VTLEISEPAPQADSMPHHQTPAGPEAD